MQFFFQWSCQIWFNVLSPTFKNETCTFFSNLDAEIWKHETNDSVQMTVSCDKIIKITFSWKQINVKHIILSTCTLYLLYQNTFKIFFNENNVYIKIWASNLYMQTINCTHPPIHPHTHTHPPKNNIIQQFPESF